MRTLIKFLKIQMVSFSKFWWFSNSPSHQGKRLIINKETMDITLSLLCVACRSSVTTPKCIKIATRVQTREIESLQPQKPLTRRRCQLFLSPRYQLHLGEPSIFTSAGWFFRGPKSLVSLLLSKSDWQSKSLQSVSEFSNPVKY